MDDPSAVATSDVPGTAVGTPTSLLRLCADVLARWRTVLLLGLIAAVIAATWSLLKPLRFRSSATFALEESQLPGGAGGLALLAGQLGAMPNGGRSLQFYSHLLAGPTLLGQVVRDTFVDPASKHRLPLVEILEVPGESAREREHAAVQFLSKDALQTSTDDQSGTVTFDVDMPDPQLAAAVARHLFDLLVRFNVETRNSAASEQRRFAERERERTAVTLKAAEDTLQRFLEANRDGLSTPRLALRRQELQRNVDVQSQVYMQLAGDVQQARIDEVRDTPVLTLVEIPEVPLRRHSPRRVRMTLTGLVLGLAAGVIWVSLGEVRAQLRQVDPEGYARLRHPFRRHQG